MSRKIGFGLIQAILVLMIQSHAYAGNGVPALLPFQGRVTDSSGNPINYPVQVLFRIYPASGSCYIYQESHNTVTPNTYGIFSVILGTGTVQAPNNSLLQAFNNDLPSPIQDSCNNPYSGSVFEWRRLQLVVDGIPLAMQTIGASAFAINSQLLDGKSSGDFILKSTNVTQANLELLTQGSDASALHNHDSVYVRKDGAGGGFTGNVQTTGNIVTTGAAGSVGVGTSSPAADLHVVKTNPTIRLESTSGSGGNPRVQFFGGGSERGRIEASEGSAGLRFYSGSTQALTIDGMSNLLAGASMKVTGTMGLGQYTTAQEPALITALNGLGMSAVGTMWVNSTTGSLRYWDGSSSQTLAQTNGVVTSVSVTAPIANTGTATSPVLALADTAVSAGSYGSAASVGTFTVDPKGRLTAAASAAILIEPDQITNGAGKYFGYRPNNVSCGDQQVLKWDNTNSRWLCATDSGLISESDPTVAAYAKNAPSARFVTTGNILDLALSGVTTGTYTKLTVDTYGRVTTGASLTSADVTTALGYTPVGPSLSSGNIWVGNGSNQAAAVSMSGDVAISNTGATTIQSSAVSTSKIASSAITTSKMFSPIANKQRIVSVSGVAGETIAPLICGGSTPFLKYNAINSEWDCVALSSGDLPLATGDFLKDGSVEMTGTLKMGGNVIYGSSAASNNLTLESTSNATKGAVILQPTSGNVGVGTSSPSSRALLDLTSTTQGFLMPRMSAAQRDAIASPATGLQVFNTDTNVINYYNGSGWSTLGLAGSSLSSLNGLTGSTQTFAIGSSGTAPAMNSASTVHTLNIPLASGVGVTSGTISKTDYDNFNNKLSAVGGSSLNSAQIWVGNGSNQAAAVTVSGDATLSNTGAITIGTVPVTKGGTGATTQAAALNNLLPTQATQAGKVLQTDGTNAIWITPNAGTVTSVSVTAPMTNTGTATDPVIALANTAVSPGSYGSASSVGTLTVDATGRLTAAASTAIAIAPDQIIDGTGKYFGYRPNNVACTAQQVLKWDNTNSRWVCANDVGASGMVASLAVNAPLTNSGTSSDPVLNVSAATTGSSGVVTLATDGGTTSSTVVQATDARLSNARTPVGTSLTSGNIWVGNSSNQSASVSMSGDLAISNTGATTIQSSAVSASKIASSAVTTSKMFSPVANLTRLVSVSGVAGETVAAFTCANNEIGQYTTASGWVCVSLSTLLDGTYAKQNGNSLAGTMTLGTNDAQSLVLETNNTARMTIDSTGAVAVTGALTGSSFLYSSDRRLKTNVRSVAGLSNILKLRGVTFDWLSNGSADVGLIAQEVESVFPQLVQTNQKTGYKAVKYGNLVGPLIEATKEIYGMCHANHEKIESLSSRINENEMQTSNEMMNLQKQVEQMRAENKAVRAELEELKKLILERK